MLTLYSSSNLVSETEETIDLLDPYQRNAKNLIWSRIMKGEFNLPKHNIYYPEHSIQNNINVDTTGKKKY